MNHKLVGSSSIAAQISGAISAELAKGARVTITASRSGSSVSGSVENLTGATMSNLTVFVFGVELGQNNHAINTVKAVLSSAQILSIESRASESFESSGSLSGSVVIVIAVADSAKKIINSKILQ